MIFQGIVSGDKRVPPSCGLPLQSEWLHPLRSLNEVSICFLVISSTKKHRGTSCRFWDADKSPYRALLPINESRPILDRAFSSLFHLHRQTKVPHCGTMLVLDTNRRAHRALSVWLGFASLRIVLVFESTMVLQSLNATCCCCDHNSHQCLSPNSNS